MNVEKSVVQNDERKKKRDACAKVLLSFQENTNQRPFSEGAFGLDGSVVAKRWRG